jgi:hypothetical protein
MSEKIYIFDTSRGAGVPGLPHVVTEAEAKALGLAEVLQAAIANGSYTVKAEPKPKPAAKEKE